MSRSLSSPSSALLPLASLFLLLSLLSLLLSSSSAQSLSFTRLSATAPWTVRHSAGLELTGTALTVGGTTYQPGSFVLFGGYAATIAGNTTNDYLATDTWISQTGATWAQVSTTGLGGALGAAHCTDNAFRLYQVGGERNNVAINEVWVSSNTGRTWTRQVSTTNRYLPARVFMDVYADSANALYAVGGRDATPEGQGYNDVYRSVNQGRDWTRQGALPTGEGGRFSATLLISYSKLLKKDIMTYIGGISRVAGGQITGIYNDIWISSNLGVAWQRVTANAPFPVRDNMNGEVTKEGYLIIVAGFSYQETYNDVWMSADGGYTWGQCAQDAPFSDRRFQMTIMDRSGYLLTAGGEELRANDVRVRVNDVWRSTVRLTGATTSSLTNACPGIRFPTCSRGYGFSCYPGTSTTIPNNGAATCSLVRSCPEDDESSSSSADMVPVVNSSSGGLSTGMILLIVALVLAGVVLIGYLLYRRQQTLSGYQKNEGLLGASDSHSGATTGL